MFRALLAHPQEALNKWHLVYCVHYVSWLLPGFEWNWFLYPAPFSRGSPREETRTERLQDRVVCASCSLLLVSKFGFVTGCTAELIRAVKCSAPFELQTLGGWTEQCDSNALLWLFGTGCFRMIAERHKGFGKRRPPALYCDMVFSSTVKIEFRQQQNRYHWARKVRS
jgi:hypothetical protein